MACIQKFHPFLNKGRLILSANTFSSKAYQEPSDEVFLRNLVENDKGIKVLNLNRYNQKNALNTTILEVLHNITRNITSTADTRVLIIKSAVPGVFCAGADLKERIKMSQSEAFQMSNSLRSLMTTIYNLPFPVLAAVDGSALGGGLELALACDIRVTIPKAKLGLVETRLAIIPGAGGTTRLPRLINPSIAKELIFTGRILNGNEAKDLGLVNHVVEENGDGDSAYLKCLEIAREMLMNGPVALEMAKFAINKGLQIDIDSALAIEEASYARVIPTKDRIEGLKAFSEKRPPKYIGE